MENKNRIWGFRSKKVWKEIIAVFYYFIGCLMVLGVLTTYKFNTSVWDTILTKVSEVFTLIIYFLPFIFLSDFSKKIRSKIPLLKENKTWKTIIFFIIVVVLVVTVYNFIIDKLHTDEYNKVQITEQLEKMQREKEETEEKRLENENAKKEIEEKKKKEEKQKKEKAKKAEEEQAKQESEKKEKEKQAKKEAEEKAEKNFVFDEISYEYKEFKTKTRKNRFYLES